MKCVICKSGETHPGKTTLTLQRGPTTVVIRDVPAEICENCGEAYVAESITQRVLSDANMAAGAKEELVVRGFAA